MTIKEIQQYVYNFLYEKKIPHITICAIMGNIQAENSTWDINCVEIDGYGGIGLCQWTFGRKTQLLKYGTDLKSQCEFLYSELTGKNLDKTKADFQWLSNPADSVDGGIGFYCSNDDFLKGNGELDFLTSAFCYCFERPAPDTNHLKEIRIPYANSFDDTISYSGNRNTADNYDKNNTTAKDYDFKQSNAIQYDNAMRIEQAVQFMINIANDETHGYNQAERWGGIDFDCSSLVITAFENAGFKVKEAGANTTNDMKDAFLEKGFKVVDTKKYMRGDILLIEGEHVVVYIGDDKIVHASLDENGNITGGQQGDQNGREICVRSFYADNWICIRHPHITYGSNNGNGVNNSSNSDSVVNNDNPASGTTPNVNGDVWKKLKLTPYALNQLTEDEKKNIKNLNFGDYVKMIFTFKRNKEFIGTNFNGGRLKFDTLQYKIVDLTAKGFIIIQPNGGLIKKINPKYIKKVRVRGD